MTKKAIYPIFLLFLIGFSLYAFNFGNRLFWDDEDWIVNNSAVHSFSWQNLKFVFSHDTLAGIGLRSNYFRPVLFLSFAVNFLIDGIKPFFYHLTSNLIHIANAILIFILLAAFLRNRLAAFLASFLFLIHPLQTEAVTYVSGRGDPLSVFFMLAALMLFLKSREFWPENWLQNVSRSPKIALRKRFFLGSVVCAILAILSRETAFLFPIYLFIFLFSFVFCKEKFVKSFKKSFVLVLPFLGLSLFYGVLRLTVLNFRNTVNFFQQSNAYTEHLSYRIFTFFHAVAVYLRLIFAPAGLHMERNIAVNTSLLQWPVWPVFIGMAGLIVLLFIFYKREFSKKPTANNQPPITNFRLWFFSAGIFFVALAPTSGIFPINALIYEHWLYFSLFGFFTLAGFYLAKFLNYLFFAKKTIFYAVAGLLTVYFVFLGVQTAKRNIIWGDTEKFYQNILRYEPDNVRAITNLANWDMDNGKQDEAEKLYWRAIEVNDILPQPYYNLGNILWKRKDYHGAIELFKKAIEVDKYFQYAYLNLASIYASQGDLKNAAEVLDNLAKVKPQDPRIYYDIAQVAWAMGEKQKAVNALNAGLGYVGNDAKMAKSFTDFLAKINGENKAK